MDVLLGLLTITNLKLLRLLSTIFYVRSGSFPIYRCHTGILHHVARLSSTTKIIIRMASSFVHQACSSQNLLIRHVFQSCSKLVYTFTGYNSAYNNRFIKLYNDSDSEIAGFVRDMRLLPQNFNVDKNTLDSIIFQFVVHSLGSFPSYFTLLFLYILSIVYHSSSLHTIICTPPLVCFSNNNNNR